MLRFCLICLGGAVGTGARYLLARWTETRFGSAFPYGTMAVNLIGSFLIAMLMAFQARITWITPTMRLTLATGVLGGFTTYSAFNQDTLRLMHQSDLRLALANLLITVFGCLISGALGLMLARAVYP